MGGLAPMHWKKFDKFLKYIGCGHVREKGDHRIYRRHGLKRPVVIPRDAQIPVFVLRNNLRILGMTVSEFLEVIKKL
jgi:predicted RNA binding protein YcfA (HicA-like mRNA interferase family)